jgi:hypothetical protein
MCVGSEKAAKLAPSTGEERYFAMKTRLYFSVCFILF